MSEHRDGPGDALTGPIEGTGRQGYGLSVQDIARGFSVIAENVRQVVRGKDDVIDLALVCLLSEGHLLIEDVPGTGKTTMARAIAASVRAGYHRIQFTPDLLPSDVSGVSIYNQRSQEFEFHRGPVFANIVLGDEINRASPKTQSALLEVMEEHQVTVDGTTYELGSPFTVVATQNPYEMEGTYSLPEAQRDRFMARIQVGYPDADAELAMVRGRDAANPMDSLGPVVSIETVQQMIAHARTVHVSSAVEQYAVAIARATRTHPDLRLGASPRATLQMVRAGKARAAILGRDYVLPDDLDALAPVVLPHRLVAHRGATSAEEIVADIIARTPVPSEAPRGAHPA